MGLNWYINEFQFIKKKKASKQSHRDEHHALRWKSPFMNNLLVDEEGGIRDGMFQDNKHNRMDGFIN